MWQWLKNRLSENSTATAASGAVLAAAGYGLGVVDLNQLKIAALAVLAGILVPDNK